MLTGSYGALIYLNSLRSASRERGCARAASSISGGHLQVELGVALVSEYVSEVCGGSAVQDCKSKSGRMRQTQ